MSPCPAILLVSPGVSLSQCQELDPVNIHSACDFILSSSLLYQWPCPQASKTTPQSLREFFQKLYSGENKHSVNYAQHWQI